MSHTDRILVGITDRSRPEAGLGENEASFRTLAEFLPHIVWATRPDGWNIYFNQQWVDYTGLTMEESHGHGWIIPFHPDDQKRAWEAWQNATLNEGGYSLEVQLRRADGVYRWWLVRGVPCRDTDGKLVKWFGTCTDIHDLKLAERNQRTSAHYARTLIEANPDPFVAISPEGKITDANEATVQVTGRTREQLIGTDFCACFTQPEKAHEVYQRALPEGLVKNHPLTLRHTDGHDTEVLYNASSFRDEQGRVLGVVAAARDITERNRAEEEIRKLNRELEQRVVERTRDLEAGEERWRFALESSHIGVWEMNLEDHTALRSAEHDRIFGYSEMLPQWTYERFLEHVLPEDRARVEDRFRHASDSLGDWDFECRIRRADGETRWIWAIGKYSQTAGGTTWRMAGIVRDITEHKQAEAVVAGLYQSLRQRTAQLEAANKELEAFSYSVSHDLRAPLRSIDGFSRILMEDCHARLDDEGRDCLARVRAASQRMAQLIDDMLQLSRLSHSELRCAAVDLSGLARDVAEELRKAGPERRVVFVIEPDLAARADAGLMRILLQNLFGNAWKFTGRKSDAIIEFARTSHEGVPTFLVRDDGVGFDMTYAHKLFGAFQRLHAADEFPGTGIGLAIVQRIIRRHGGRVWAEGKLNQGATFYFTLPEQPEEPT